MAIQNILSGGFYGKLGEVVGQRWKNKRTLRTYVIPFDPKTPEQLENREQFKLAVELAQEAMAINKGSSAWKSPRAPEFSLRVKTAKLRLKNGATPEEALPLFPDGDFAPLEITLQNFEVLTDTNELKFEIQNYTLNEPSNLKMSFVAMNVTTLLFELVNFEFDKNQNPTQEITVLFDWKYIFISNSYFIGSSIVPRFGGKQPIILYPTLTQETTPIKRQTELNLISFAMLEDKLTLFFQAKDNIFFNFETQENIPFQIYNPSTQQLVNKTNGELKTIGFGTFLLSLPKEEGLFFAETANISNIDIPTTIEGIPYSIKIPSKILNYETLPLQLTLSNFTRPESDYKLRFTIGNNTTGKAFTANFKLNAYNAETGQNETISFQETISENLTTNIIYSLDWKYCLRTGSTIQLNGVAPTEPENIPVFLPVTTIQEADPNLKMAEMSLENISIEGETISIELSCPYTMIGLPQWFDEIEYELWNQVIGDLDTYGAGEAELLPDQSITLSLHKPHYTTVGNGSNVPSLSFEWTVNGVDFLIESGKINLD